MLIKTNSINYGVQNIHRFANSYGASVVSHEYSYGGDKGLWEIAVIKFNGESNDEWYITCDTPITDDVLGYLEATQIDDILAQIEAL